MSTKLGISKRACAAVIGRAGLFIGDTPAVGQTENEIEALWGEAVRGDWKDGTRYLAWERRSFVLIAAMDGERSICLHFVRPSGRLYPLEIRALLDGSANGSRWTPFGTGHQKWRREDGGALALYDKQGSLFIYDTRRGVRLLAEILRTK